MDRKQKEQWIEGFQELLTSAELVIVTHYTGLTVSEVSELRDSMRKVSNDNNVDVAFKVTKNRLALRAIAGTNYESLSTHFVGPTGVAFSSDPIAAAKCVVEYAKNNKKLVILGGAIGSEELDPAAIQLLAKLPSLDELRAKLIAVISTPGTRLATLSQAPASSLARVLNAYATKEQ